MTAEPVRPILRPGETCWRMAKADRLAVIIDAATYFAIIRKVVQRARHSVIFVGWDFDTRIELEPGADGSSDVPNTLGGFLEWVVGENDGLEIHMLKWDIGLIETLSRGSMPLVLANWMTQDNIHMRLDGAHPAGATHHQKIVVIDDVLAFCGGIDITAGRWDTREHRDDDPRRNRAAIGTDFGPWHDVTTAVSGAAAKALGDLTRNRWQTATGETLNPPEKVPALWPDDLEPLTTDRMVAISRTMPPLEDREEVREIEALYLEIIRQTKKTLYIESQYFASPVIARAMAERLAEVDGPEIVVINPHASKGWLEEKFMGASRARMLEIVQDADAHDRFRLYTPMNGQGTHIYVHAKVVIMDDRLLRVGSSNLNNRSMGFDTECDLSLDAATEPDGGPQLRQRILDLRDDLLSEHLDLSIPDLRAAIAKADGSLVRAIDGLRGEGRSLLLFVPPDLSEEEKDFWAESDLLDPESVSDSILN